MKKYLPLIICAVLAIGSVTIVMICDTNWKKDLKEQGESISEMEEELGDAKTKAGSIYVYEDRVEKDNEKVTEFLQDVMTWSSYEEYIAKRDSIAKKYDITEENGFLHLFMPEIEEVSLTEGVQHNWIDDSKLHFELVEIEPQIQEISKEKYTYFTIVKWKVTVDTDFYVPIDSDGYFTILEYDMDEDHNISNIHAWSAYNIH